MNKKRSKGTCRGVDSERKENKKRHAQRTNKEKGHGTRKGVSSERKKKKKGMHSA